MSSNPWSGKLDLNWLGLVIGRSDMGSISLRIGSLAQGSLGLGSLSPGNNKHIGLEILKPGATSPGVLGLGRLGYNNCGLSLFRLVSSNLVLHRCMSQLDLLFLTRKFVDEGVDDVSRLPALSHKRSVFFQNFAYEDKTNMIVRAVLKRGNI